MRCVLIVTDLDEPDGEMRDVEVSVGEEEKLNTMHLRIIIVEGYAHFCCVKKVDIL